MTDRRILLVLIESVWRRGEPLIGISLFGILFGILSSDRHFSLSVTSRALWPLPPARRHSNIAGRRQLQLFCCRRRRRTMTMTDNTTTMILLRRRRRRRRRRRTKTMTMKPHPLCMALLRHASTFMGCNVIISPSPLKQWGALMRTYSFILASTVDGRGWGETCPRRGRPPSVIRLELVASKVVLSAM